jgi:uncharacterized cupin superfamily protein
VVELTLEPGALGASPHVHNSHEEDFVVLDGVITFATATGDEAVDAGGSLTVPRGTPHGFRNDSARTARCLMIFTPAGYEDYFREVSRMVAAGHEPSPAELDALRADHDTTRWPLTR